MEDFAQAHLCRLRVTCLKHQMHLFLTFYAPLRQPRVVSRASCGGARGSPARTLRRTCRSRPVSLHGIAFRLVESRRTTETPQCNIVGLLLLLYHTIPQVLKLSTSLHPWYNNSPVTAKDGASVCVRVCVKFTVEI